MGVGGGVRDLTPGPRDNHPATLPREPSGYRDTACPSFNVHLNDQAFSRLQMFLIYILEYVS